MIVELTRVNCDGHRAHLTHKHSRLAPSLSSRFPTTQPPFGFQRLSVSKVASPSLPQEQRRASNKEMP